MLGLKLNHVSKRGVKVFCQNDSTWLGHSTVRQESSAPSHYLKQCWLIFNWTLVNKFKWNLNRNSIIFIKNAFEIVFCQNGGLFVQGGGGGWVKREIDVIIMSHCVWNFELPSKCKCLPLKSHTWNINLPIGEIRQKTIKHYPFNEWYRSVTVILLLYQLVWINQTHHLCLERTD